jgi:hypothetical protein
LITDITGHLTGSFVLAPKGSSFDAFNKMNLIAGDDAWFSPVAAEVWPDGAGPEILVETLRHDNQLWRMHATRMLAQGEEQVLEFVAPEEPGDYPYVCTFPGHWRVMNGLMKVE